MSGSEILARPVIAVRQDREGRFATRFVLSVQCLLENGHQLGMTDPGEGLHGHQ